MKHLLIVSFIVLLIPNLCVANEPRLNLPHDQEAFFKEHQHVTKMRLKLDKNTDAISPAIGQLKNLHTIALIINYSVEVRGGVSIPPERQDVTIPLELLNLPNLRTLEVNGALNLRLPPKTTTSQIQSHIEQVIATRWAKNSIPFLDILPLHQLKLITGVSAHNRGS